MSETSETSETIKTSETSKNNKITAVEKSDQVGKTERTKDPRKVELGKRLAKISKEAKERKARQREANQEAVRELDQSERSVAEEINDYVDFRYIVGGVAIVAALGGLYYAYKNDTRLARRYQSELERSESDKNVSESIVAPKQQAGYEITKCKPSTTQTASRSCIENL